ELLPEDVAVGAELALPVRVGQDDDVVLARLVFIRREAAPQERRLPEYGEQVGRRERHVDLARLAAEGEAGRGAGGRGHAAERARLLLDRPDVRPRPRRAEVAGVAALVP